MELFKILKSTTSANAMNSEVLVNKLKEMDDISAIEFSCQRLNLDLKKDLFQNDDYLSYFLSVDEKTRIIVEKVTNSYVKIDIINHHHKKRIANAAFLHHRLMFSIYFKLIVALAPSKHPQLGMLIGRAINNAAEIIKWRYFNHQTAPGNVWLQISNLFDMAEKNGLTNQKIALYPDLENAEFVPTTIASNFIAISMLGSLDNLSFKTQQIDFLSKMLSKWTSDIAVENEYNEKKHLFSIDLSKNMPAKRIRNLEPSLTSRYWCLDTINIKIQIFMNCIETSRPPKQKSMKMLINNLYAYPTLQMIKAEWSLSEYKRQRRESPRIKTDKVAKNAYGFEDTYYQIKHFEDSLVEVTKKSFKESTFEEDASEIEEDSASIAANAFRKYVESMTAFVDVNRGYCNIVDESAKGICIHVTKQPYELAIGMMLGVSVKEQKFGTKIGIIRSIKPTLENTLRIGVEILSRTAFCVEATNISQEKDDNLIQGYEVEFIGQDSEIDLNDLNETTNVFNCLFLPREFSFSKEESFIFPKNQFKRENQYQVNIANKMRTIQLTDTLEQHENWIRVNFIEL